MASTKSYKARGIVLRKTKLGEKDLIVTILREDGSLLKAIAKGARKPGGTNAARFELFSTVDALFAQGKSLDVATEARFAPDSVKAVFDLEQSSCAASIAEFACLVAQEGLEQPRLYAMTSKALSFIAHSDAQSALAITSADLLKTLALEGLKPSFDTCVLCGSLVNIGELSGDAPLSIVDGGIVCGDCKRPSDTILVDSHVISWARALLYSKFEDIESLHMEVGTAFAVLHFTRQWIRVHMGKDLKSLDFLMTSGLF